jgi:outer membrane receptor protein involved in Fe transport
VYQTSPGLSDFAASLGKSGANPQLKDLVFTDVHKSKSSEKAIFGELTYHFTPAWQITGGFRFFHDEFRTHTVSTLPWSGFGDGVSEPIAEGTTRTSAQQDIASHVFKANTSYDFSRDAKIYFTYARGFRRGGANGVPVVGPFASLPEFLTYTPDTADNYEVGVKGRAMDRRLRYSLSAYLIDFNNFQFNGVTPSLVPATFNGSEARSQGIELETQFHATDRLELSLGYALTDAKVVKSAEIFDLPILASFTGEGPVLSISIPKGARLPGVSRHSVTAAADYTAPLPDGASLLLHADGNYRSAQNSALDVTTLGYFRIPDMFIGNLRVVYDSGRKWTLSAFVNNVTNEVGYTGGKGPAGASSLFYGRIVSRPRTFGTAFGIQF